MDCAIRPSSYFGLSFEELTARRPRDVSLPLPEVALVAARTLVWVAVGGADLGETPADDVSGGDEPDDHPSPRGIEIVCDGRRNQCCGDNTDHRPELRRQVSPLRLGRRPVSRVPVSSIRSPT